MTKSDTPKNIDQAFPPLESEHTKVLVLGSMPSQMSLKKRQYYGHPQNAFWRIMAAVTGVAHDAPYEQRARALLLEGVSVWDAIASCHRPGSMDADIDQESVTVNDFDGLLKRHPTLELVLFNGQASAKTFNKHLGKNYLSARGLRSQIMPSTSPAYASKSLDEKKAVWLASLKTCDSPQTSAKGYIS